jgi:hypothetical protein
MSTKLPEKIDISLLQFDDKQKKNVLISADEEGKSSLIKIKTIDDYFTAIEKCYNYTYEISDFFFPPRETFLRLCISYDKTYLFIVSFVRCLIYLLATKVYVDVFDISDYWNNMIFTILIIICIINIVILFYVMIKGVKLTTYNMMPTYSSNNLTNVDEAPAPRDILMTSATDIYPE